MNSIHLSTLTILLVVVHHRVSSLPTTLRSVQGSQDALESPDTHQDTIGTLSQLVSSSGIYGQFYDKPVPTVQGTVSSRQNSRIDDDDGFGESLENNHIPDDVMNKLRSMSTINPMGGNSLESRQIQLPQQPMTQIIFNPLPESDSTSQVIPIEFIESRGIPRSRAVPTPPPFTNLQPFANLPSFPETGFQRGGFVRQSLPKQLSQPTSIGMHPDAPSDPSNLPIEETKESDPLPDMISKGTLPIASWLGPLAHRPEPAPTIGDWFSRSICKPFLRSWGIC